MAVNLLLEYRANLEETNRAVITVWGILSFNFKEFSRLQWLISDEIYGPDDGISSGTDHDSREDLSAEIFICPQYALGSLGPQRWCSSPAFAGCATRPLANLAVSRISLEKKKLAHVGVKSTSSI